MDVFLNIMNNYGTNIYNYLQFKKADQIFNEFC